MCWQDSREEAAENMMVSQMDQTLQDEGSEEEYNETLRSWKG